FFVGGGIVYSLRARDILFDLPREAYAGMRGASTEYALLQARAIRDNFGADWGLAESGSVGGGSKHPGGAPAGQSCAALVGPDGEWTRMTQTHSHERISNMEAFAHAALSHCEKTLRAAP
ncbi:MAG: CinA family protein, partial [Pontixanthobacter sp.]